MVAMIEDLIGKGHAYAASGHVLFRVRSYAAYGALSGRSVDDMIAGARVEVSPFKEDPMDFVLWKPSSGEQPEWASPWGFGRPGWHIECSAMAGELLGPSFDIHGGGLDLQFPHHENELAQSSCAHPDGGFARVWMHNEMLQVEGKKMSKSLGNFFTVRDLLDQGVPGEVIRFVLLGTHYRKPMDWTEAKHLEAEAKIEWFIELIEMYGDLDAALLMQPNSRIVSALAEDLNTHEALRILGSFDHAGVATELACNIEFLGILSWSQLKASVERRRAILAALRPLAEALRALRVEAKLTRDFRKIDALKSKLSEANISVMMNDDDVYLRPESGADLAKLAIIG
jgi:cysteinyl-tRNA synthetase